LKLNPDTYLQVKGDFAQVGGIPGLGSLLGQTLADRLSCRQDQAVLARDTADLRKVALVYVPPGVEGSEGWNSAFFEEIGLGDFVSVPAGLNGGT
jgi:hypothetical protein